MQVAVLLIKQLPHNTTIEDYARNIGNKWKVGNDHNGLVYVAVLNERRQRLEVAGNLEGDIPDITAKDIIDHMRPYLQQQDYFNALQTLVAQIDSHLENPQNANSGSSISAAADSNLNAPVSTADTALSQYISQQVSKKEEYDRQKSKFDHYGNIATFVIVLGAIAFCIWAFFYKKKYWAIHTVNGVYTGYGSVYDPISSTDSGGGSSGDFGGFGGGGGGGFSGGGASGSW